MVLGCILRAVLPCRLKACLSETLNMQHFIPTLCPSQFRKGTLLKSSLMLCIVDNDGKHKVAVLPVFNTRKIYTVAEF